MVTNVFYGLIKYLYVMFGFVCCMCCMKSLFFVFKLDIRMEVNLFVCLQGCMYKSLVNRSLLRSSDRWPKGNVGIQQKNQVMFSFP